jgi:hypothetical protein
MKSIATSILVTQGTQTITAPGILNLFGDSYCILKIPEIESHMYKGRSYEKHSFGVAQFKLAVVGYASSRFDYSFVPYRRFHPIGQLSSMTLNFYRPNGRQLYAFHGVNHNLIMVVRYLIPKMKGAFDNRVLNPCYEPDPFHRLQGMHDDECDDACYTTDEEMGSESEDEVELAGPNAIHKYG